MKDNAYTVSQINHYISRMFAEDFALNGITIKGEVSNLKYHTSGHIYFTLKDTASQISAIMFLGNRAGLKFKLEDGMQILCTGSVGVYEKGGSYQFYVRTITADGVGDLYIRFEQLKKELSEMGMFDAMYKNPVPKYASRIGIVTAKTGAAVRDIIQISRRRNPYVELILYPAQVQGEGAAESVAEGIRTLDRMGLDTIIVGRGGGSIEDLWAFNEETVAKAIFDAETPVISAVGHETDTTIADYVSDLRAPTPSAAAELAVYDYNDLMETFASYRGTLDSLMEEKLAEARQQLALLQLKVNRNSPAAVLKLDRQKLARTREQLLLFMERRLTESRNRLRNYEGMRDLLDRRITESRHHVQLLSARMEADSPVKRLSGGFGYIAGADGKRIDSILKVKNNEVVETVLKDGSFRSRVLEIDKPEGEEMSWQ